MAEKILAILGMHRSGTSLLANWLQNCGIPIGDRLLGANESNQKGHFEDWEFVQIHQKLLKERKLDEKGLIGPRKVQITPYEFIELVKLIQIKNKNSRQWGWKDPRTTLFIHQYKEIIPELKAIIIFRHYNQVVNSLLKREKNLLAKKLHEKRIHTPYNFKRKLYFLFNYIFFNLLHANKYLSAWCIYNEALIQYYNCNNTECIFLSIDAIKKRNNYILEQLADWGFQITPINFSDTFSPELLSIKEKKIPFLKKLL
ncbi:MAG: hypothetical protein H6564_21005 [Lewinellaceae bacterium]|nr:hypothetical protein [Lewinellaceae bacterium]